MTSDCLIVAYGMGVDSTAMLVGMVERGIRPDAILFADTGGEKDETYAYLPVMQAWLLEHGFPPVTVVNRTISTFLHQPPYSTLEENCLTNGTLPSVAFGWQMASCSQKWKIVPQHKWIGQFEKAVRCWGSGNKVTRYVGFDASTNDRKRTFKASKISDKRYCVAYPLQDWGWTRERCQDEIAAAGLPVPMKSSCFFCPAMHTNEVSDLPKDKLRRIVVMEARAEPRLRSIKGLWGVGRKGVRGGEKRPGMMTDFIVEQGLLHADEVKEIRRMTPLGLVSSQPGNEDEEDYVAGWPEFHCDLARHLDSLDDETVVE